MRSILPILLDFLVEVQELSRNRFWC
jgi:hypothetical protein